MEATYQQAMSYACHSKQSWGMQNITNVPTNSCLFDSWPIITMAKMSLSRNSLIWNRTFSYGERRRTHGKFPIRSHEITPPPLFLSFLCVCGVKNLSNPRANFFLVLDGGTLLQHSSKSLFICSQITISSLPTLMQALPSLTRPLFIRVLGLRF